MAAASAAKKRAVPSQLKATRATVWRMAGANGAKKKAASRQLEATRVPFRLEWNANDYVFASLESCVNKSPMSKVISRSR